MFGVSNMIWVCFLLSIILAISATYLKSEFDKKNHNKHIFLERNNLGCEKYSFNYDVYWKCPDKSIKSIEVSSGKHGKKLEPVINEK